MTNFTMGYIMVFNATFNYISVISWWSVLFVVEIGVPRGNHRPSPSHWQTLSHIFLSSTVRIRTHNFSIDNHWLHRQLLYDHDHDLTTCIMISFLQ